MEEDEDVLELECNLIKGIFREDKLYSYLDGGGGGYVSIFKLSLIYISYMVTTLLNSINVWNRKAMS